MSWNAVCAVADIADGEMKQFTAEEGFDVLVVNVEGDFFAYQAMCPHLDIPLVDGFCDGELITCMEHMWQFDARNGGASGFAEEGLTAYGLKVEDGRILVETPDKK